MTGLPKVHNIGQAIGLPTVQYFRFVTDILRVQYVEQVAGLPEYNILWKFDWSYQSAKFLISSGSICSIILGLSLV